MYIGGVYALLKHELIFWGRFSGVLYIHNLKASFKTGRDLCMGIFDPCTSRLCFLGDNFDKNRFFRAVQGSRLPLHNPCTTPAHV